MGGIAGKRVEPTRILAREFMLGRTMVRRG